MLVSEELGLNALVKIVPVSAQVRVSLAYVVVMLAHVSYPTTFAEFVRDDVGFATFVIIGYFPR